MKCYFKPWFSAVFDPVDITIHKRFEFLYAIKDSLELHLVSLLWLMLGGTFIISEIGDRVHYLSL